MPINEKVIIQGEDRTGGATRSAKRNIESLNQSSKKLNSGFSTLQKSLIGVGAALATGSFARGIIATTARFEDLRTSLSSVTGSAKDGQKAFDFVSKFATKTQFSVEDLSTSFIKLKASGIQPTEKLLTLFTDTAAITTDQVGSLTAITDLFARSVSGGLGLEDLNRLADRGVPVFKILEEQLGLTRLEISNFGKTAEGAEKILDALSKGINEKFGGATNNLLKNLSTQISNLGIASRNAQDAIGRGGLSDALGEVITGMTDALNANEELFLSIGEGLGNAVRATSAAFGFFIDNIKIFKALGLAVITFKATTAMFRLATAMRAAGSAAMFLNKKLGKAGVLGVLLSLGVAVAEMTGILDMLLDSFKEAPDPVDVYSRSLGRLVKELGELENASDEAYGTIQDKSKPIIAALRKEQNKLNETLVEFILDLATLEREEDEVTEAQLKLKASIEDTKDAIEDINTVIKEYETALMDVPLEEIFVKAHPILVEQISLFDRLANKSIKEYSEALSKLSDQKLFEKALTPTQKEKQSLKKRLADIEEFKRRGIISEEEYQRRKQEAIFDSDKKIIDLAKERRIKELEIQGMMREDAEKLYKFEEQTALERTQWVIGQAQTIFDSLGKTNKKAFEAAKAYNTALAIMNTYTAATKALATYPPPFNFIAAAAVVASGLAQVATIQSQQYSGRRFGGPVTGGSSFMVGEAGPEVFTPSTNGTISQPGELDSEKTVNINFTVNAIDAQSFSDTLLEQRNTIVSIVNEAVHDNGKRAII
jgi:hypothetical protein